MKKCFVLFTLLVFLFALCACGEIDTTNPSATDNNSNTTTSGENTEAPTEETDPIIYADNDGIQAFLTVYNKMYPDEAITSDMLTKYYHHGKEHDGQVKLTIDGYSVIISGSSSYFTSDVHKVSVNIDNNTDNNDGIKALFFKIMRVFDNTLTDETLEDYWTQQTDNGSTNIDKFGNIECWTSAGIDNHVAEYTQITGEVPK